MPGVPGGVRTRIDVADSACTVAAAPPIVMLANRRSCSDTAAVPIRRPRPSLLQRTTAFALAASLGAQTAVDAGPAAAAAVRTAARRALCADLTACAQHHLADQAIPGI